MEFLICSVEETEQRLTLGNVLLHRIEPRLDYCLISYNSDLFEAPVTPCADLDIARIETVDFLD